jgi:adenylate kinase family enzyme
LALLSFDDPLPERPQRVVVAGTSGSGKSTLASTIADRMGVPYQELDALFHGPDWTELPDFYDNVERFTSGPTWVCEFQYEATRPMLADRADTLVYLLYPRWLVTSRVVRRTLRRRFRRERLWNDNEEGPLWTLFTDPEHIIRWSWRTHSEKEQRVAELSTRPDLTVVALHSPKQARHWVEGPLGVAVGRH